MTLESAAKKMQSEWDMAFGYERGSPTVREFFQRHLSAFADAGRQETLAEGWTPETAAREMYSEYYGAMPVSAVERTKIFARHLQAAHDAERAHPWKGAETAARTAWAAYIAPVTRPGHASGEPPERWMAAVVPALQAAHDADRPTPSTTTPIAAAEARHSYGVVSVVGKAAGASDGGVETARAKFADEAEAWFLRWLAVKPAEGWPAMDEVKRLVADAKTLVAGQEILRRVAEFPSDLTALALCDAIDIVGIHREDVQRATRRAIDGGAVVVGPQLKLSLPKAGASRTAESDGAVEAVARAICKAEEPEFDPGADANGTEPALWLNYMDHAEAAITASRAPEMRGLLGRLATCADDFLAMIQGEAPSLREDNCHVDRLDAALSEARALLTSLDAADKEGD
jgi:hypothetical protein